MHHSQSVEVLISAAKWTGKPNQLAYKQSKEAVCGVGVRAIRLKQLTAHSSQCHASMAWRGPESNGQDCISPERLPESDGERGLLPSAPLFTGIPFGLKIFVVHEPLVEGTEHGAVVYSDCFFRPHSKDGVHEPEGENASERLLLEIEMLRAGQGRGGKTTFPLVFAQEGLQNLRHWMQGRGAPGFGSLEECVETLSGRN